MLNLSSADLDAAQAQSAIPSLSILAPTSPMGSLVLGTEKSEGAASVLFVDQAVADYQSLLRGVAADTSVYVLTDGVDGLAQMTEVLLQYARQSQQVGSVQILSHGGAGSLLLAGQVVDGDALLGHQGLLQSWQGALTADADILLYGCNVGLGEVGQGFVSELARLTQADVAASDDVTGNAVLGGDWDLEHSTGAIDSTLGLTSNVIQAYQDILPTLTKNQPITLLSTVGMAPVSKIDVAAGEISGSVTKVTVTLTGLTHSSPNALNLILKAPNGKFIKLLSDAGGTSAVNNINLTFDDNASAAPAGNGLVTGTYKPTDYSGDADEDFTTQVSYQPQLSDLISTPDGLWLLFAYTDSITSPTPSISGGWSLNIETVMPNNIPSVAGFTKSQTLGNEISFSSTDFSGSSRFTDADSADSLVKIKITSGPTQGTLKRANNTAVSAGDEVLLSDLSSLKYIPTSANVTRDSFQWQGSDGKDYSASAQVTLNFSAVPTSSGNTLPIVYKIDLQGNEDTTLSFSANSFRDSFSDSDAGDSLVHVKITSLPSHGTLWFDNQKVTLTSNNTIQRENLDRLTYVPNQNFYGKDSFAWNGSDGKDYSANTALVNLTINNIFDAPTLKNLNHTVYSGDTLGFTANHFMSAFQTVDRNNSLKLIQITSLPVRGALYVGSTKLTAGNLSSLGTIRANALTTLTYKAPTGISGYDSFTWNATDTNNQTSTQDSLGELWIARRPFLKGMITSRPSSILPVK